MKESEALGIIKSCIKHNHFSELNQYAESSISAGCLAEILARTILERLLKEGFNPPPYFETDVCDPYGNEDGAYSYYLYGKAEFEPE